MEKSSKWSTPGAIPWALAKAPDTRLTVRFARCRFNDLKRWTPKSRGIAQLIFISSVAAIYR